MTKTSARSILVIEDDRTLNRLLCVQLADLGYSATGAYSRLEALDRLTSLAPVLALLAVRVPDCDGLSFLPVLPVY